PFCGSQLESELLLQRREDRWPGGARFLVRGPFHSEVVFALHSCVIDDRPSRLITQVIGKSRHGCLRACDCGHARVGGHVNSFLVWPGMLLKSRTLLRYYD